MTPLEDEMRSLADQLMLRDDRDRIIIEAHAAYSPHFGAAERCVICETPHPCWTARTLTGRP